MTACDAIVFCLCLMFAVVCAVCCVQQSIYGNVTGIVTTGGMVMIYAVFSRNLWKMHDGR